MSDIEEIVRLWKEYEEALDEERDAASRAASAADALHDHGIDVETDEPPRPEGVDDV